MKRRPSVLPMSWSAAECFINGYCASDARVAFGGVKKSGFGRELSHFGLHEFCNVQTVWRDRR
ncbi:succinate-semialdehyde dehydrogenase [Klebsiella michiganensis]|uniref:Succinate-semialdehyde dehydrogenase n=1 Tax=Klebsiella michiganensis TaxID=1134687 RepID=A0A7H4MYL4_9ENTR|nr:succinate-semialdehyde dehydrogenase [Klebsiella michiganensis]